MRAKAAKAGCLGMPEWRRSSMDQQHVEIAERQLDRVLQFASRIEAKLSVLFASNLGILAIALLNLDYTDITTWYVTTPLFSALVCVAVSLFHVYRATYPSSEGGGGSLIYFSEIAKRTEHKYVSEFKSLSADELHSDLLGQIWRNSQIMKDKFDSVKRGFVWAMISLFPWVIFLATSSIVHSRTVLVR
jgi:hypothetical protein